MHLWLEKVSALSEYEYAFFFCLNYFMKMSCKSYSQSVNSVFFSSLRKYKEFAFL